MLLEKLNERLESNIGSSELGITSHLEAPGESGLLDKAIDFGGFSRTVELHDK